MNSLIPFSVFSLPPAAFIMAFFIDLAIGDPRWLPHPVRLIGIAINNTEKLLRRFFKTPAGERFAGILLVAIIVIPVFLITILIIKAAQTFSTSIVIFFTSVFFVYLIAATIATGELMRSVKKVIEAVESGDLENAKLKLSMIVGRDTQNLSEEDIIRAAIESLSENLSDGVIAPIFYLTIGGIPFAMAYKAINTLDSMVGYKNQKYINFGWASARLDDYVNYIPARITGILIVIAFLIVFRSISIAHISLQTMLRDGGNHSSPNSGIPEAAMAGGLGVRLGGPSTYGGILFKKHYIGEARHRNYIAAAKVALSIVWYSSILSAAISSVVLYILYINHY